MKLYEFAPAPNPRRVRMYLAEKGLLEQGGEIERVPVDMLGGAHKQPDFLAKSPLAQLPVLELEDGTCLTESLAICRYFEALHPAPSLFGQTPAELAQIEMWNRRVEFGVFAPAVALLRHTSPILAHLEDQNPQTAAKVEGQLLNRLEFLDQQLAGRTFISPTGFSIADITAFAGIDFTLHGAFTLPETMPALRRWYEQVKQRPSSNA